MRHIKQFLVFNLRCVSYSLKIEQFWQISFIFHRWTIHNTYYKENPFIKSFIYFEYWKYVDFVSKLSVNHCQSVDLCQLILSFELWYFYITEPVTTFFYTSMIVTWLFNIFFSCVLTHQRGHPFYFDKEGVC